MRRALASGLVVLTSCAKLLGIDGYTIGTDAGIDADAAAATDADGGACMCPFGCDGDGPCVTALAAGFHETCALSRGDVWCWGQNDGVGSASNRPVKVTQVGSVTGVSVGVVPDGPASQTNVACAVETRGAECWGQNFDGELGSPMGIPSTGPVYIATTQGVTRIAAGGDHVCGLSGAVIDCWGSDLGQIGDGQEMRGTCDGMFSCDPTPTSVSVGFQPLDVEAGASHTCAVAESGNVYCWGLGKDGQLGNDDAIDQLSPVEVVGSEDEAIVANALAVGANHACVIDGNASIQCWGADDSGQLGNGLAGDIDSAYPVAPIFGAAPMTIAAGANNTCAILTDNTVYCWGANQVGTLGNGSAGASTSTPTPVPGAKGAVMIAVGYEHVCVALADGAILCWGSNDDGELGDGIGTHVDYMCSPSSDCSYVPVTVVPP